MHKTASEKLKIKDPWLLCSRAEIVLCYLHYSMLFLQLYHSASGYGGFFQGANLNIHTYAQRNNFCFFKKSTVKGPVLLLIRYNLQNTPTLDIMRPVISLREEGYHLCVLAQRQHHWDITFRIDQSQALSITKYSKRNNTLSWPHQRGN